MSGNIVDVNASLDPGYNKTVKLTLTTADAVRTVAIPSWATWVRIYSDKVIRIALNKDPPAAEPAKADANVAAGDLGIGAYVMDSRWEERRLPNRANDNSYTLRMLDDAGGAVVRIEFCRG